MKAQLLVALTLELKTKFKLVTFKFKNELAALNHSSCCYWYCWIAVVAVVAPASSLSAAAANSAVSAVRRRQPTKLNTIQPTDYDIELKRNYTGLWWIKSALIGEWITSWTGVVWRPPITRKPITESLNINMGSGPLCPVLLVSIQKGEGVSFIAGVSCLRLFLPPSVVDNERERWITKRWWRWAEGRLSI